MKYVRYVIIVLCFASFLIVQDNPLSKKGKNILKKIPEEDQKLLENFLRYVTCNDQFGYALFGAKATSTSGYFGRVRIPAPPFVFFDRIRKDEIQTFRKYLKIFNSRHFLLKETPYSVNSAFFNFTPGSTSITLIHKKKFLEIANKYLGYLQDIIGEKVTPEEFLLKVEFEDRDLHHILNHNDGMYGLFLGFGKESSDLYQRREDIEQHLERKQVPFINKLKPSPGFASIQQEYQFLRSNLCESPPFPDMNVHLFEPVDFIPYGGKKTRRLLEKYENAREEMAKQFLDRTFLEVFLEQIHAEEPIYPEK